MIDTRRILSALRGLGPGRVKCDSCSGRFPVAEINPCSGDYNLCTPCLRDYLNNARQAADEQGGGGFPNKALDAFARAQAQRIDRLFTDDTLDA